MVDPLGAVMIMCLSPFYAGVFHLGLLVPKGNEFILAPDRALVACSISCNSLLMSAIGARSGVEAAHLCRFFTKPSHKITKIS